jgi:flagellar basal-body rod protein FlgF
MDSGYYAALTGLVARMQAFEVTANNTANMSTTGYKVQREFYKTLTASLNASKMSKLSPLNRAVNNYGVLGGSVLDLRNGTLERTGNDLDVALEGPGFFVIQTKNGPRYTRNGSFRVTEKGRLVSATGDPVLGEKNRPIDILSGPVSISPDGTLSQNGAVVGKLRIVDFAPGTSLAPEGNSIYAAPTGTERALTDTRVRQGSLESSNQDPVSGVVNTIILQRHIEILQRALSIFNNDFDQTAAQQLAQVSG